MSSELRQHVRILYLVTHPVWDWYSDEVTRVKTPEDGLRYSIKLADGAWRCQSHVQDTWRHALHCEEQLAFMGLPADTRPCDPTAEKVLALTWHIVRRRCWSSTKHDCPPECYAGLASSTEERQRRAVETARADWQRLMDLEQV